MARSSKNPRGGGGLLFLAGLGLEVVVGIVAFRTVLADELRGSDLADLLPRKDEAASAPATPLPATPAEPTPTGSMAQVQEDVVAAMQASAVICAGLATDSDRGAQLTMRVAVGADGRVTAAEPSGVSGPLAACLQAEAEAWQLTAAGVPTRIVRSIRLD